MKPLLYIFIGKVKYVPRSIFVDLEPSVIDEVFTKLLTLKDYFFISIPLLILYKDRNLVIAKREGKHPHTYKKIN